MGLEKTEVTAVFTCGQHSWPSMEICELCCIIWPLTPCYPILITWKVMVIQEKCTCPKECTHGIIYLCSGRAKLLGTAQTMKSHAQHFPHWTEGTSFAEVGEGVVRKDMQGAGACPMPFVHPLNVLGLFSV